MASHLKSVFFFILCFGLGFSAFYSKFDDTGTARNPAAINGKVFQITTLSSEEIRDHLAAKIRVMPTLSGTKTIKLSGFSAGICKNYSEIEMIFKADGVAVAGEVPTLKVKSPCKAGQDPAEMAAIVLPVSQMLNEKYRNAEFSFNGFEGKFTTAHAADTWPKTWVLYSVKFINVDGINKTSIMSRNADQNSDLIVLEL